MEIVGHYASWNEIIESDVSVKPRLFTIVCAEYKPLRTLVTMVQGAELF